MRVYDVIVVGQGLAGTTLSWALKLRNLQVAILDRGGENSSSRIAAGLITPVTGQRMAASWRYPEFFSFADAFYRQIEEKVATSFFHRRSMVRLFLDIAERQAFANRAHTLLQGLVSQPEHLVDPGDYHAELGGFVMPNGARLDTAAYLRSSRTSFELEGDFYRNEIDTHTEICMESDTVTLSRLGLRSSHLIFCQGFEANAFFPDVPFNPVKGEVLTLRIPKLQESRVVHRGAWLAPTSPGVFLAGSTYERDRLDTLPSNEGREQIITKLSGLLRHPYEILEHRAGIRPVLLDGRPMLGFHPRFPRLGLFNGLGSKGALIAPFFACQLADALLGQGALETAVSPLASRMKSK